MVRGVQAGERGAREEFLDRMVCVPRIIQAQNRRLGGKLDANDLDDVVQEVQLTVWRKLDTFEGRSLLETWVFRFCRLATLQYLERRRRARERIVAVSDEGLIEAAGASVCDPAGGCCEEAAALDFDELMRHLSSREAEVTRLRHVDQLEFGVIAKLLQISVSSAKTHYYRSVDKLKVVLNRGREDSQ